jgi:ABC-2 type transport system permease protein
MRLAILHARATTVELVRLPAYVVPTLGFPTMFFLFFAASYGDTHATILTAQFAAFAILGVAFFQFGVGIASDRASPWDAYVRTLPVTPLARFSGRIMSALLFGGASAVVLVVVALAVTPAELEARQWAELSLTLLLGAVPFALLGIALGYVASPRAALPIANVAYLGLSFLGGLWMDPANVPGFVGPIAPFLPTGAFADTLAGVVYDQPGQLQAWATLAAYTLGFGALAVWGYRRDEGQRFR